MVDTSGAVGANGVLSELLPTLKQAASEAESYFRDLRAMVAERVAPAGKVDRRLIDVEQRSTHGLAWVLTYVETLKETANWADRINADGKFGEMEQLLSQILFGEYLSQLIGGLPMWQSEIVRPIDMGATSTTLARLQTPAIQLLVSAGNTPTARRSAAELIRHAQGKATFETTGLDETYGDEFEELYTKFEAQGKYKKQIPARELWDAIIESQIETGNPYMLYKDNVNKKSQQKNIGIIRSSNLCTEIVEHTSPDEVAVCNLASVALNKFVKEGDDGRTYDHEQLWNVVYHIVGNLNKVIDGNAYPVKEAKHSNLKHRPVGLGVQGLADTFALLKVPFESDEATTLNKDIFETIYHAALTSSKDLARTDGAYETFPGSPASEGVLQFDMWGVTPESGRYDWKALKAEIQDFGLRNSLLLAPMPTASTSQILGNNECFEPFTSNLYTRRTLSGEFVVINKHLVRDLLELDLWNDDIKDQIVVGNGSIQHIESIPVEVREIYKTTWEIKQRKVLDMAADRGAFIDQSQSLNLHVIEPNFAKLTSMHFHAWKRGLKTGMYYLRTKAASSAIKFTVDADKVKQSREAPTPVAPISEED